MTQQEHLIQSLGDEIKVKTGRYFINKESCMRQFIYKTIKISIYS